MKLKSYTVYDEMSAGLTLDKDSVKVALLNAQGQKVNETDLAPSARHKHLLEPFQSAAGIFLIFLRSQAQRFAPSPWAREFF